MKLTKVQRKTLQFFQLFHSEKPTIGRQLIFNWFAWLPLLASVAVASIFAFTPAFANMGWWMIGVAVGAFGRDIGRFRQFVRVWPVYKEVVNWQRVSELLESNEKDQPQAGTIQ
jgi:hypothetical protein